VNLLFLIVLNWLDERTRKNPSFLKRAPFVSVLCLSLALIGFYNYIRWIEWFT